MHGNMLSMKIYVTSENLEKLDKIREHLNSLDDVKSGNAECWTKSEVYEQLFNNAIENYKF